MSGTPALSFLKTEAHLYCDFVQLYCVLCEILCAFWQLNFGQNFANTSVHNQVRPLLSARLCKPVTNKEIQGVGGKKKFKTKWQKNIFCFTSKCKLIWYCVSQFLLMLSDTTQLQKKLCFTTIYFVLLNFLLNWLWDFNISLQSSLYLFS